MNTDNQDIRWIQRFENYKKTFLKLEKGIELATEKEISDIEKLGIISYFLKCYPLMWKTLKDFYEDQGELDIQGARDAFRLAFNRGLLSDNMFFSQLLKHLQLRDKLYESQIVDQIFTFIMNQYFDTVTELNLNLEKQKDKRIQKNV